MGLTSSRKLKSDGTRKESDIRLLARRLAGRCQRFEFGVRILAHSISYEDAEASSVEYCGLESRTSHVS
jgi:hypothetical protein